MKYLAGNQVNHVIVTNRTHLRHGVRARCNWRSRTSVRFHCHWQTIAKERNGGFAAHENTARHKSLALVSAPDRTVIVSPYSLKAIHIATDRPLVSVYLKLEHRRTENRSPNPTVPQFEPSSETQLFDKKMLGCKYLSLCHHKHDRRRMSQLQLRDP